MGLDYWNKEGKEGGKKEKLVLSCVDVSNVEMNEIVDVLYSISRVSGSESFPRYLNCILAWIYIAPIILPSECFSFYFPPMPSWNK